MSYIVLPPHLHQVADDIKNYYRSQWGITASNVKIEQPIDASVSFVTTLHASTKDHYWICVEVAESAYINSLDPFVLDCKNRILPVRLYVATPAGVAASTFQADLSRARRNGVGVLEVTDSAVNVLVDAVSLSLSGLREPEIRKFPLRHRQPLSDAVSTFKSGNPVKGCSVVYDEVEAIIRRIAEKALRTGSWNRIEPGKKAPKFRPHKDPWARIIKELLNHLDEIKLGYPNLNTTLLARILGVTPHRNDSGHKPSSRAQMRQRDSELRTRFESACDLLLDVAKACRKA